MADLNGDSSRIHLDDVLGQLGAFGRHQAFTMAMLALVYATNSIYNVNYVFAVEDAGYRCKVPSCDGPNAEFNAPWLNQSLHWADAPVKQCWSPPVDDCARYKNATDQACTQWVYENPDSFVAEIITLVLFVKTSALALAVILLERTECFVIPRDVDVQSVFKYHDFVLHSTIIFGPAVTPLFELACDDWKQTLVGTVHSFGSMVGLLIQGQISDRYGRKTAAVFAGTMGAVLGLTKSFASSFWFYIVLEGLEAAIGDALSPMFMLSIELVEKRHTVLFQMILLNCYTCGLIVMPFIAWAVPYWRNFLRVIYAPTLLILSYSFFLDESIRWLYSKGQKERAVQLIQKIAKRNGVEIDRMMLDKLDYVDEETKSGISDMKLLMKTFKSKIMMQRFLVCMVWWFTITLINYGMMISAVHIAGNKYVNFSLLMLMDIPANVFYWLALSKYKRKMPLLVSFLVGGVFCISQPFVPKGYAWLGLTLFMAFEMLATFSYNIVYMYTSELFPTYTRNSMHAICGAVGRVGSLVAPQTPLLMSYWAGLPTFLFGVTSIFSGSLTLLMPETARTELPDTVAEAEQIGRKKLLPKTVPEQQSLTKKNVT